MGLLIQFALGETLADVRKWAFAVVGVASVSAGVAIFGGVPTSGGDSEMIAAGKQLYMEHCASCHGRNLEGQPDWRRQLPSGRMPAPPHDASGHTWHHGDRTLARITRRAPARS